jgi:hypothetical protein
MLRILWIKVNVSALSESLASLFKTMKRYYAIDMDERKKLISELEQQNREQIGLLDTLLVRLGEAIFGRTTADFQENNAVFGELAVFRRLRSDIAASEASIQTVEEQIQRFKELEENIQAKELEETNSIRELSIMHGRIGKLLLDATANPALYDAADGVGDFCLPYRDHADALLTKVLSLEERLSGLEQKEGGNVFTWIGKNTQSLVLRSFLTKAQENLEQLRRTVGERYTRNGNRALPGGETETTEIDDLCAEIEQKRAGLNAISQDLAELRDEKNTISVSYNAEGGPLKRIQILKNHIAHVRDELKGLYKRVGADAASINTEILVDVPVEISAERSSVIGSLVRPEDTETMDSAERCGNVIRENEIAIEKLQVAIAIDEEREKITRYRKMIQGKKEKIAQAERNIAEYERGISDSEAVIHKLQDKE